MGWRTEGGFIFVGEKPSETAHRKGWTWESGRLAAKTLFEALREMDVQPEQQVFLNLFGEHPAAEERAGDVSKLAEGILRGRTVVAMGMKVDRELTRLRIEHKTIRHPAARGAGRAKAVYHAHVREALA